MRQVAPQVAIDARGAGRHADDAEIARGLLGQHARGIHPIGERAGIDQRRDELVELRLQRSQMRLQIAPLRVIEIVS